MKKLYALLMAGMMAATFAMPAMAAPSPTAQVIEAADAISVPVAGTAVTDLRTDIAAAAVEYAGDQTFLSSMEVSASAKLSAVFDLSYSGAIPEGGVQIPVVVSSAKPGDVVYVLHRQDHLEGMPWEKVGQATLDGSLTVTCTFQSFSPVMILVVDAEDVPAAAGIKSPKTGE